VLEKDGSLAGIYRKMHIPDDPGFYEKFYFTPGDLGFHPIQTSVGKLGVLVCWDQWYPEGARLMALAGADLLLYPTAIGWVKKTTRRSKAASGMPGSPSSAPMRSPTVCGAGVQPHRLREGSSEIGSGLNFWGSSFVAGPQGEILAQADTSSPTVLVTDVDMAVLRRCAVSGPICATGASMLF